MSNAHEPKRQEEAEVAALPWSFRAKRWQRILVSAGAGLVVGVVGTLIHRLGAAYNIPVGFVLAMVIVGLSAWSARARAGVMGLTWHLITSTVMVWMMAQQGPGGDILIAAGFGDTSLPWWCQHVGVVWLLAVVVVQLVMYVLPKRWFAIPTADCK